MAEPATVALSVDPVGQCGSRVRVEQFNSAAWELLNESYPKVEIFVSIGELETVAGLVHEFTEAHSEHVKARETTLDAMLSLRRLENAAAALRRWSEAHPPHPRGGGKA